MKTAMAVSGHKTIGTFMRYHIINREDVANALGKLGSYLDGQPAKPSKVVPLRTITATVGRQN